MWQGLKQRFGELAEAWGKYECASLAAGVAFYAGLSLFPLMLVLISGVGFFFRFMQRGQNARDEIIGTVSQQISPAVGDALERVLSQVQDRALVNGPLAGVAFLMMASLVFAQIDRGFMRIWEFRERPGKKGVWVAAKRLMMNRARSLVLLLGTCLVVVLVFVAGIVMRAATGITREWFPDVPMISGFGTMLIGLGMNVMVFFILYRFLSKEKVEVGLCLKAGVLAAAMWECGSRLMTTMSFGSNYSAYGLIGSFLVVQVWIYYNVMVLFIGALVVRLGTRPLGPVEESG